MDELTRLREEYERLYDQAEETRAAYLRTVAEQMKEGASARDMMDATGLGRMRLSKLALRRQLSTKNAFLTRSFDVVTHYGLVWLVALVLLPIVGGVALLLQDPGGWTRIRAVQEFYLNRELSAEEVQTVRQDLAAGGSAWKLARYETRRQAPQSFGRKTSLVKGHQASVPLTAEARLVFKEPWRSSDSSEASEGGPDPTELFRNGTLQGRVVLNWGELDFNSAYETRQRVGDALLVYGPLGMLVIAAVFTLGRWVQRRASRLETLVAA